MSKLTLLNGKLRLASPGGKLVLTEAAPCCCEPPPCPCSDFFEQTYYTYEENTGSLPAGPCQSPFYIRGEQVITIPGYIDLPCYVSLQGGVNDDLVVDGAVIEEGQYPFGGTNCNGAHEFCYVFFATSRTFTIAVRDNFGFGMGAQVTIRFCR